MQNFFDRFDSNHTTRTSRIIGTIVILLSLLLLFKLISQGVLFFQNPPNPEYSQKAGNCVTCDGSRIIPMWDYILVVTGFLFLTIAIVSFQIRKKPLVSLMILMVSAVIFAIYSIRVFDFLLVWDEQYHALVAKNMIGHPFKPMFYADPILPYDLTNWSGNHVWMHKQPLFLWQMAFSIWLFGAKAWAVRFPDLVMTIIMVPVIYRMGSIIVDNRTGFWAAVFFTVSHFMFELVSGSIFTDHNDVAFVFYVTLSIWSWLEYVQRTNQKGQLKFIIFTGLFAGAAILVKWLPGLLVYSGWGLYVIMSKEERKKIKSYLHILLGLIVTVAVALPWQIYTLIRFPLETKSEYQFFYNHFSQPLDGHNGDGLGWHYYISNFRDIFSIYPVTWILISIVFVFIAYKKRVALSMIIMVVIVFVFFSFAATKMPAFTFITVSIILLVFGSLLAISERIIVYIIPGRLLQILLITCIVLRIAVSQYNFGAKYYNYYAVKGDTEHCISERAKFSGLFREFGSIIPESRESDYVIMNCPWDEIPQMMFYTGIKAAYDKIDNDQLSILKSRKDIKLGYIVFCDEAVPENIQKDNDILKIRFSKPISVTDLGKCTSK